jgi:hypothetical protein
VDPLKRLAAIESIKLVKAKYFRFVDTQDWDGLRSVFTPDATLDFPEAGTGVIGIDQALALFKQALEGAVSVHFGHTPEIEIESEHFARAVWPMDDRIYWPPERASILGYTQLRGFGHYHETYEHHGSEWKIKTLRLTRLRLVTQTHRREIAMK